MRIPAILITILAFGLLDLTVAGAEPPPGWSRIEGEHIILEVRSEDMQILDDPHAWVKKLDRAYEALADLVGDVPFNGAKITIRSAEDVGGAWARAGNPITWKRDYIPGAFRDHVNRGDWLFGIIHEISHNFDLDGRWAWDCELTANFKMDYAFEKAKAVIFFDGGRVCDYGDPRGLRMTDYYRRCERKGNAAGRLLQGGWGTDMYHGKLADLVSGIGWEPVRKAFRWMNSLSPGTVGPERLGKRSLFIRAIDEHTDFDVAGLFLHWGFSYLAADVQDPNRAAELLGARDWTGLVAQRPIRAKAGESVSVEVELATARPTRVARGLGTHAPSKIVYDLGGRFRRFESLIGVHGPVSEDGHGTVVFKVVADGNQIYESRVLRGGGAFRTLSVPVAGVRRLELLVSDAGDNAGCDVAAWGEARVIDSDGRVMYLSDTQPILATRDGGKPHAEGDLDNRHLVFPFRPHAGPARIVGELADERVLLQRSRVPGVYEGRFGPLQKGVHMVRVRIRASKQPITQHELVTILVE